MATVAAAERALAKAREDMAVAVRAAAAWVAKAERELAETRATAEKRALTPVGFAHLQQLREEHANLHGYDPVSG